MDQTQARLEKYTQSEIKVQDITNEYVAKVDSVIAAKEKDIMTV